MRNYLYPFLSFWALFIASAPSFAGITFDQNQAEIEIAPSCNHVPVSIPYIPDDPSYDESLITVSSDSEWAIPSVNSASDQIEIAFTTEDLIASYTATIFVDDGESKAELFVHVNASPLDIYRLLDDPLRSKTYGIQKNGIYNGSIIAFDPIQESLISCVTVGESPTDFVINDDSSELLVINSVGQSIDVIDLETFSLKETIYLPTYDAWGSADDTTANIDLGPDDIIYYSDGAWGPVLHVLQRSTNEVIQSMTFNDSYGFMDFAVTSDKTRMVAMPQYGWSAGVHSSIIGQFTINGDGTVNFVKETSVSGFDRAPFEAPVLMRDDNQIAVMKTISTDPADTDNLDRFFPSAIWSMNSNGTVVATGDKLYEYDTGIELYTIPGGSTSGSGYTYRKAQAFTSDFTRFIYFNSTNRTLNVVNLIDEIGHELLGLSLNPANGSVVNAPEVLTWEPLTGIDQYDVYLGTYSDLIATADQASPYYLGRVNSSSFTLLQTLTSGTEYYWRIDPVSDLGPETGEVYSFTVSEIGFDINEIDAQTVAGHSDYQVDIQLTSADAGVSWSASASDSWVTFTESTGSTPSTLSVHLDSTLLSSGFHDSSITFTTDEGELKIPIQLEVEPLNVTHIRSDRNSAMAYAISENTNSVISQAYLLEIDTETENIERVIPVGSSVTDFTIHYADNLIYVTNWQSGNLLAIDKSTFEHIKSFAFQPAGAGDVYRVSAGASERLVVEEKDQWIDIGIYNTDTETILDEAYVREGGGAFGPAGRYYYHGENNSSGADIIKFDTSGDTFTNLVEVRPPEISSYYGSRTVVVSEDGSRIFWAGVVLDQDLETEWGIGEIIYSSSTDGRYAFGQTVIYDIDLRRQVLEMPTSTTVSGYNSTSEKLITQVDDALGFYVISSPISFPAPILSFSNSTDDSIYLSWTDDSLELEFVVQQRLLGTDSWVDTQITDANVNNLSVTGLQEGSSYEFRVRASSPGYSSPWSNIVIKQEDDVLDVLGRTLSPMDGAIINAPDTLTWTSIPWIDQYDIYLGTDENAIATADTDSAFYLGRVSGASFDLAQALVNGTDYFWRIDPVSDLGPETGRVYTFTASDIGLDVTEVNVITFAGHSDYQVDIQLVSEEPGISWAASAADSWVTFTESTGATPSTLSVHLDTTELSVGSHNSTITLTSESDEVQLPVQLQVEPLNITHIRSDRNSSTVYAISEDTSSATSQAYLLEINSRSENILRVIPVGSSVTDFTIHYADNLIYVTNWKSGNLLAFDKDTLELTNSIAFEPAGAGDVYRVAAGASERLVVEEEDQWIDIDIFNTDTQTVLDEAFVREGGGAFGPAGRYYYHGENNSSGADIIKFDTSGDTFTSLVSVRPSEISSYYGSRTVVVSEDGSRVFWAGVALDENLETEWGIGELIYSSSTDGRYAFAQNVIYDIDLRRQVLSMPASSTVSGYNSTTEKLITQVEGALEFHAVSFPISIPAPVLSASNPAYDSVDLDWTDESLEMEFVIQQRVLNSDAWTDIQTTAANVINWTATALQGGLTYEFRVRASTPDYSSPWSNVAIATLPEIPNVEPVAEDDVFGLPDISNQPFSITENDRDSDGDINPDSIAIVTQPQYGEVIINTGGEVTYIPGGDFVDTDSFSYTIEDNDAATSAPATVTITLEPAPVLLASNPSYDSIDLSWTYDFSDTEFFIQQREMGSSIWFDIRYTAVNATNWTAGSLQQGVTYDFRVRTNLQGNISPWSNVARATVLLDVIHLNEEPIAENDVITMSMLSSRRFSLTDNDSDSDGEINLDSIEVVDQPQFGQIEVHSAGEVTYTPGSDFVQTDSFSYTIEDNDAASSSTATVTIIYMPTPTLSVSNLAHDSIEISWTHDPSLELEYIVQRREFESDTWIDIKTTAAGVTSMIVVADLEVGSTYEFRVRSSSNGYSSLWSNIAIATVPEEPEPSPSNGSDSSNEKGGGGSFDLFSIMLMALALLLYRGRARTF